MNEDQSDKLAMIDLTVGIVSAYVSNNHVQAGELTKLITEVHGALAGLGTVASVEAPQAKASPAEIRRSVTPEHLISFEDGKQYKTLRRHLTLRDLTPEQYRAKWGLPSDYPMTSAKYSEQRSQLAVALGLGQQRRKGAAPATSENATPVSAEPEAAPEAAPKAKRGRSGKSA